MEMLIEKLCDEIGKGGFTIHISERNPPAREPRPGEIDEAMKIGHLESIVQGQKLIIGNLRADLSRMENRARIFELERDMVTAELESSRALIRKLCALPKGGEPVEQAKAQTEAKAD